MVSRVRQKAKHVRLALADRDHVVALKCAVCAQFRRRLESMRNYRSTFIDGTTNVRTSTFKEHARTDMHTRAMSLFKKQHSSSVLEYAHVPLYISGQRYCMSGQNTSCPEMVSGLI